MENMMVQTEKMMSVGGLAAGMAHEINNPLGGMLQSLQNVTRRLSPGLPANEADAAFCGTRAWKPFAAIWKNVKSFDFWTTSAFPGNGRHTSSKTCSVSAGAVNREKHQSPCPTCWTRPLSWPPMTMT